MANKRSDAGPDWSAAQRTNPGTAAEALHNFLNPIDMAELNQDELKKIILHFFQGPSLQYHSGVSVELHQDPHSSPRKE